TLSAMISPRSGFLAHAPEGAYPKVGEQEHKSRGQEQALSTHFSSLVLGIFIPKGSSSQQGQRQKEKPGHLQPEQAQHAAKVGESDLRCACNGRNSPAAARLPRRYSGSYPRH